MINKLIKNSNATIIFGLLFYIYLLNILNAQDFNKFIIYSLVLLFGYYFIGNIIYFLLFILILFDIFFKTYENIENQCPTTDAADSIIIKLEEQQSDLIEDDSDPLDDDAEMIATLGEESEELGIELESCQINELTETGVAAEDDEDDDDEEDDDEEDKTCPGLSENDRQILASNLVYF